jgi:hypothetical protein
MYHRLVVALASVLMLFTVPTFAADDEPLDQWFE